MNPSVQDANLISTVTLPAGATTTKGGGVSLNTSSTGGEFSATAPGDFLALCELLISVPALSTAQLPDTDTITYNVIASQSANMSSPETLSAGILVQTGAGGTGAAAATARYRFPTNIGAYQYFALQAVGSASGVAASGASATAALCF